MGSGGKEEVWWIHGEGEEGIKAWIHIDGAVGVFASMFWTEGGSGENVDPRFREVGKEVDGSLSGAYSLPADGHKLLGGFPRLCPPTQSVLHPHLHTRGRGDPSIGDRQTSLR